MDIEKLVDDLKSIREKSDRALMELRNISSILGVKNINFNDECEKSLGTSIYEIGIVSDRLKGLVKSCELSQGQGNVLGLREGEVVSQLSDRSY